MTSPGDRPRVVIAGAGFAGLWAARRLKDEPVDVLVLDRNNYHTFLPLLYQVAAAELGPTEIAYPVRSIFRDADNVSFRMASVERVEPERKEVVTDAERIPYDHLLLALGSQSNFFGIEGVAEHGFPLKEMAEAIPLRHHILSRFERAVYEEDPDRRRALLTFTIVGGGLTGVEFAGALAELVHGPLCRDYPMLDVDQEVRILLLEGMDRLLLGLPEELGEYARSRLAKRKVEVRTGAMVSRVEEEAVHLDDGTVIPSGTVVWTAGVKAPEGTEEWGFPVGKGGRIRVEETLQVAEHPEVLVAGDLAHYEQDGEPVPGVAPLAIQQGEHAAENLLRMSRGLQPLPFHYDDPGMLAVIGRNAAVANVRGRSFTGFFAWILWLIVHVAKLIGFRNRVLVLVNWAWNYLAWGRSVRLILPAEGLGPRLRELADPEPGEAAPGPAPTGEIEEERRRARGDRPGSRAGAHGRGGGP